MAIYNRLILAFWFIFLAYWVVSAIGVKKQVPGSSWWRAAGFRALLFFVVLLLAGIFLRFVGYHQVTSADPLINSLGVAFCAAGIAFAIWARWHLGRNFGVPMSLKEGQELVTSGPYRFVRHPIYAGILLAMLGSVLAGGHGWLIPLAIVCAYLVYSTKIEDRLMVQQFPKEYPEYQKRTKALIPFIW